MEVDKTSFQPLLLDILTAISQAHFVSFDLELSGVASKKKNGMGKPTLQERYEEVKEAAERYQILQIGLTCVHEDEQQGKYIARPYNFNINPVVEERLDVERIFSFQSGAVEFLLGCGFRMELPFTKGVPYLSRDEAKQAKKLASDRLQRSTIPDIQLAPEDSQSIEFMRRVRSEIDAWKSTKKPFRDFLNIGPVDQEFFHDPVQRGELSRFEKRLVHQLVRAEYPDLVSVSKRAFMQIVPFNQEREDAIKEQRMKEVKERIHRQTGFRWLVEAMSGGDLPHLDPRSFARNPVTGEAIFCDLNEISTRLSRATELLKRRRTVLVGHNLFTDLIYFYRTFIGKLPATIKEHQRNIHALFPMVIDTKYMATHNCGDINPASSLEQIADQLNMRTVPAIEVHPDHPKYLEGSAFHEAGYDSFLTAKIAVHLSTKLEAAGSYVGDRFAKPTIFDRLRNLTPSDLEDDDSDLADPTAPSPVIPDTDGPDALAVTLESPATWQHRAGPTLHASAAAKATTLNANPDEWTVMKKERSGGEEEMMPPFGTDFWRVYGNKLRVFGTREGLCDLTA
ncbi:ribonuclease H-like domain-containing protein [Cryomyces antarcticus]